MEKLLCGRIGSRARSRVSRMLQFGMIPSPMVKDEEIDVIAWKPREDKTPGTYYLLGQVASGDKWVQQEG